MSEPLLEALRMELLIAGMVAERLKEQEKDNKDGSTYAIAEEAAREIEYLSEQVRSEIEHLERWAALMRAEDRGGDAA